MFLLKTATIVIAIIVVISLIMSAGQKHRSLGKGDIKVTNLGELIKENSQTIQDEILSKVELKELQKEEKEKYKQEEKEQKQKLKESKKGKAKSDKDSDNESADDETTRRLYVLDFDGDVEASDVESLREEITAILSIANPQDEILMRLKSPGGMVHAYGLAASQLKRIGDAGYKLTIAVDEIAASGGYMMAVVADKIVAAPFSIIGSIGVLAEIPNFNRLLKKAYIDYEQHTAGDFKRTLTMFGENTTHGREKFKQELEETHQLFKVFINENRPQLDVEAVATGEHWYGRQALNLGLIDEIKTSDDLILEATKEWDVYAVKYEIRRPLSEKLSIGLQGSLDKFVTRWLHRSSQGNLYK